MENIKFYFRRNHKTKVLIFAKGPIRVLLICFYKMAKDAYSHKYAKNICNILHINKSGVSTLRSKFILYDIIFSKTLLN